MGGGGGGGSKYQQRGNLVFTTWCDRKLVYIMSTNVSPTSTTTVKHQTRRAMSRLSLTYSASNFTTAIWVGLIELTNSVATTMFG